MSLGKLPYPYQAIILHHLPRNKGWTIIGVKSNNFKEIIAKLTYISGWHRADQLADQLARELAGKSYAEVD